MIFLVCFFGTISAQQTFLISNFGLDKYEVNPAYAGMDNKWAFTARYRNQWQGVRGNPEIIKFNSHLPLYNINGGTGFKLSSEKIGAESNTSGMISYNQVIPFEFGLLSFSLAGGILNKSIDGNKLISAEGEYVNSQVQHHDDFIPGAKISTSVPSWEAALYFYSDYADFGIVFADYPLIALDLEGIAIQKRYWIIIHGNYFLHLSSQVKMEAFGLVRSDMIQWQSEIGMSLKYLDRYFASLQIRGYDANTLDALSIGFGGRLNENLLLSYHYDISLSPFRRASNGSHEFLIRYFLDVQFGKKIPESILHNPRFYD